MTGRTAFGGQQYGGRGFLNGEPRLFFAPQHCRLPPRVLCAILFSDRPGEVMWAGTEETSRYDGRQPRWHEPRFRGWSRFRTRVGRPGGTDAPALGQRQRDGGGVAAGAVGGGGGGAASVRAVRGLGGAGAGGRAGWDGVPAVGWAGPGGLGLERGHGGRRDAALGVRALRGMGGARPGGRAGRRPTGAVGRRGRAALWSLRGGEAPEALDCGPYAGWTAVSLAVGPDNRAHLLWTRDDGAASVWRIGADGLAHPAERGPYEGWSAVAAAAGREGASRLLWRSAGGLASLWDIPAGGDAPVPDRRPQTVQGPFEGWTPAAVAPGADGGAHVLWRHDGGGRASVWRLDEKGGVGHTEYGPYAGWAAVALALGP